MKTIFIALALSLLVVSCGKDDDPPAGVDCKPFHSTWVKKDQTAYVDFQNLTLNSTETILMSVSNNYCYYTMTAIGKETNGVITITAQSSLAVCVAQNGTYNYEHTCNELKICLNGDCGVSYE